MKALTLHQPWASLIAYGVKAIETRSWAPPKALLGERIAIHAGRRVARAGLSSRVWYAVEGLYGSEWWNAIPTSAVVCTAVLADARRVQWVGADQELHLTHSLTGVTSGEKVKADPYGDFGVGRWLWFLRELGPVEPPVPAVGHQGFWDWEERMENPDEP